MTVLFIVFASKALTLTLIFVGANVSRAGTVHCAAFPTYSKFNVPTDVFSVRQVAGRVFTSPGLVEVTLSALSADSNYTVYCSTQSLAGDLMNLETTLKTRQSVRTLCCPSIQITKSYQEILEAVTSTGLDGSPVSQAAQVSPSSSQAPKVFSFVLDSAPASLTSVRVSVRLTGMPSVAQCSATVAHESLRESAREHVKMQELVDSDFLTNSRRSMNRMFSEEIVAAASSSPSNFVFENSGTFSSPSQQSLSGSFLVNGSPGCFLLTVSATVITTVGAASPSGVYKSASVYVLIRSRTAPPPAPKPLFAVLSNDGLQSFVYFDADTDTPGGQSIFPCTMLLSISASISTSSCYWLVPSTLVIIRPSIKILSQGLFVLPWKLRSRCDKITYPSIACGNYSSFPGKLIQVDKPRNPIAPIVKLSAPRSLSYCDDIVLNPTASSGDAGVPWSEILWHVEAVLSIGTPPFNSSQTQNLTQNILRIETLLNIEYNSTYSFAVVPAAATDSPTRAAAGDAPGRPGWT